MRGGSELDLRIPADVPPEAVRTAVPGGAGNPVAEGPRCGDETSPETPSVVCARGDEAAVGGLRYVEITPPVPEATTATWARSRL